MVYNVIIAKIRLKVPQSNFLMRLFPFEGSRPSRPSAPDFRVRSAAVPDWRLTGGRTSPSLDHRRDLPHSWRCRDVPGSSVCPCGGDHADKINNAVRIRFLPTPARCGRRASMDSQKLSAPHKLCLVVAPISLVQALLHADNGIFPATFTFPV
jgi:hypothetical protein